MIVSKEEKNTIQVGEKELFLKYPWFYDNLFYELKDTIQEFFQIEYDFRFMGVSYNEDNVLFFGDEYFINKLPINKTADIIIRISSDLISSLLNNALGVSDVSFSINELTDIEAMLIKSFTEFIYKRLENIFIKTEPNKKMLKNLKIYNFTFFLQFEEKHIGKLIISVPDYTLNDNIEIKESEECFDISCFEDIKAPVSLRVGATRISLNDIKAIENGDVIMLEESNVKKMALIWEGNLVDFNIIPNPALIISVDSTGGEEMSDDTALNNENMWDTILVDVVAEFDNFKLTLGELKQISEGLVIDVGSVYNNKVKLKVAKQVVASGELVILNDRYGVRIDNVNNGNNNDDSEYEENEEQYNEEYDENYEEQEEYQEEGQDGDAQPEGNPDENFNYSDFEIEDESI